MTFKQLQDAVKADRFRESQRGDIMDWLNYRYAWLWDAAEWTFKRAKTTVTVTANSSTVSNLPADLGTVRKLRLSDGTRINYMDPDDFDDLYFGQTATDKPQYFTIVDGDLSVGPISSVTDTGCGLFYDKSITLMAADSDTPAFPAEMHFALVHGASAEGLKLQNDFTWQAFEQDWSAAIQTMKAKFLLDHLGDDDQYGRLTDWDW